MKKPKNRLLKVETFKPQFGHTPPDIEIPKDKAEEMGLDLDERNAEQDPVSDQDGPPRPQLPIIDWKGRSMPHNCPHCHASLLQDRMTKACKVKHTRPMRTEGKQMFQDREMLCLYCRKEFLAREKIA